jgi:hypothetical protein
VVYAYDSGSNQWALIPSQVDERKDVTLEGQCTHVENMFAQEDGLLDADDELALMAADLGDLAADGVLPPGDALTVYRLEVTDPRQGGGQGWAYVTASASAPPPPADYVSYTTTRSLPDPSSVVPEDTSVDSEAYQAHFSGRWTMDALAVKPGPDILDKYRGNLGGLDNPAETEKTWDQYSWTLYFKDGPVRALRVIRGAASGPATTYIVEFYRSYIRWRTNLRVHSIGLLYRFFDYNANAIGMTYYRSTTSDGFTIDGIADDPGTGLGNWDEVTGAPGTLAYYLYLDTNVVSPYPQAHYRDATDVPEKSGGDGNAYGNHGVYLASLADTDCMGPTNYLHAGVNIYILPPSVGRVGDAYAELEENPMQVTVADLLADYDADGVADIVDNCPAVYNPGQENTGPAPIDNGPDIPGDDVTVPNGDTLGDACDPDLDNDWMPDTGTDPILGIPGEDVGCGSGPTDPLEVDTDGDTVVDGAECLLGSDPNNAGSKPPAQPSGDSDKDGLPASVEALFGSSDSNPDTDGDGISDGLEVKGWATSPTSTDTDGDSSGNDGCKDDKEIVSVNTDKQANILDVQLIARMAFGLLPPHPALDINKDGAYNVLDAQLAALNSTLREPHHVCR